MSDLHKRAADIGLTAKQIADETGLAAPTVSRILRGEGDFLASTRKRVLDAIQKHERERHRVLEKRVAGHQAERVRA